MQKALSELAYWLIKNNIAQTHEVTIKIELPNLEAAQRALIQFVNELRPWELDAKFQSGGFRFTYQDMIIEFDGK